MLKRPSVYVQVKYRSEIFSKPDASPKVQPSEKLVKKVKTKINIK